MKGKISGHWKGGIIEDDRGYVLIWKPEHPQSNSKGYVKEHRLVMEKKLGRFLKENEVVHHIDFNKKNNLVNNLMLFKSQSEHKKYHWDIEKN